MADSVIFEIKTYLVVWRQLEMRDFNGTMVGIRGMVRCAGDEYSMDVIFVAPDSPMPMPIIELDKKRGYMFMPISDMTSLIDVLRYEKPIYGHLRADRPEWTSITTSQEPVGEGEETSEG
ncbi:MAG: hypothetical protein OHK0046_11600 [Anaerolineae bacterium]